MLYAVIVEKAWEPGYVARGFYIQAESPEDAAKKALERIGEEIEKIELINNECPGLLIYEADDYIVTVVVE
jgi:hypothetical protein